MSRRPVSLAVVLGTVAIGGHADAAGLYATDRGVRPLARGGAFVAGADDLNSIAYNPAGLADAGTSVLLDASLVFQRVSFERQTRTTDAAGNPVVLPSAPVSGTSDLLPIPTLGASWAVPGDLLTLAIGVYAPYTALLRYPETVQGGPAPQRYSLISLEGTALADVGAYAAFKPAECIRLGLGLDLLLGTIQQNIVMATSPGDRLLAAPENPAYDARSTVRASPVVSPGAIFGATWVAAKWMRVGGSVKLPFIIDAPATVQVRLPSAPEFDGAAQQGQDARVRMDLPMVVRAGIEGRPIPALRIEGSYVWERWSTQKSIDLIPENIAFTGITAFPSPYPVPPMSIPRNFTDTSSIKLGAEWTLGDEDLAVDVRAGRGYGWSAIPRGYLTPLTVDLDRATVSMGVGVHIGRHWRIDGVFAQTFSGNATVPPDEAQVPALNPVRSTSAPMEAVNGGTYAARTSVWGLGANLRF